MSAPKAGNTVSIRLPPGVANRLRAATGQPVSTLVRFVVMAYLERLERERGMVTPSQLQHEHEGWPRKPTARWMEARSMAEVPALPEQRNVHELLSKPTQELTAEDRLAIVAELRKRRERYLQGTADKLAPKKAPAKTAEEKQAIASTLLGDIASLELKL